MVAASKVLAVPAIQSIKVTKTERVPEQEEEVPAEFLEQQTKQSPFRIVTKKPIIPTTQELKSFGEEKES